MKEKIRSFNPFIELFETSTFPHARTLRTSLRQKFIDAFSVISGFTLTRKHQGLLDYATLFIPRAFSELTKALGNINAGNGWSNLIYFPLIIMLFVDKAIITPLRALTAGLLVLLASPVIILAHLVSRFVDKVNLDNALVLKGKLEGRHCEITPIPLEKYLENYQLSIEDLTAKVEYNNNFCSIRLESTDVDNVHNFVEIPKFALEIKDSKSHNIQTCLGIHSFFSHNIGNVVSTIEQLANDKLTAVVSDFNDSDIINPGLR